MLKLVTSVFTTVKYSLANYLSSRYRLRSLSESQAELETWLETTLGQRLLSQQRYHIDQLLHCLFGYHVMQLGISRQLDLASSSPINHRFQLSPTMPSNKHLFSGALAEFEQLPLASESIDVGILHHVLDYSPDPYQTLSEASRVIIPQGYLLIVGFNHWSVLGLCKPIAHMLFNSPQWRYHSLSLRRLTHWLKLLDFEPVCKQYDYYGFPSDRYYSRLDTLGRRFFPGCGAFYVLLARKQVTRMTPIKTPLRKKLNTLPQWGKASPMPQKQK